MKNFLLTLVSLLASISMQASEKAYLHLDNTAYFLGDTIRLAAYVMDTETKRLTDKSKVLYVELLAPEGYVVESHTYSLKDGMCEGDFYLRPLVMSGIFEVRAYTRYMQNDGDANCFSQVVPVYERVKNGEYTSLSLLKRPRHTWGKKLRVFSRKKDNDFKENPKGEEGGLQIRVSYDKTAIHPYSLVTMKLKGMPNSQLSLSITDASNHIDVRSENIERFVREDVAMQNKTAKAIYEPEQSVTIYGKMGTPEFKLGKGKYLLGDSSSCLLPTLIFPKDGIRLDMQTTDKMGCFKVPLGNFSGDAFLQLKYKHETRNLEKQQIVIDYDMSPKARKFTKDEMSLWKYAKVNGRKIVIQRRHKKEDQIAVTQVDLIKLFDRMSMESPEIYRLDRPLTNLDLADVAADGKNYSFVDLKFAALVMPGEYPGDDSIPTGTRVNGSIDIKKYKEMIVRTDYAMCSSVNYLTASTSSVIKPTFGFLSGGYVLGAGSLRSMPGGYANMVSCFVPDKEHEWEKYIEYNKIPNSRTIKVSGLSPVLPFRLSNYSRSHPASDYRRTLYWNPSLQLDENGEATIQFFNNGTCKEFFISGEGVSEDGKAIVCK